MISHNVAPDNRYTNALHVESHRRMHEDDPRSFAELSSPERLGRGAMLGCVALPNIEERIREELAIFQSELDFAGLAEDR
jgi:hypothetical protein